MNDTPKELLNHLQNNDDYKKCDEYIYKIVAGDNSVVNEANSFVINKYEEFRKSDEDLIIALGITKVTNASINDYNIRFSVIGGLSSIKQLIEYKYYKELLEDK